MNEWKYDALIGKNRRKYLFLITAPLLLKMSLLKMSTNGRTNERTNIRMNEWKYDALIGENRRKYLFLITAPLLLKMSLLKMSTLAVQSANIVRVRVRGKGIPPAQGRGNTLTIYRVYQFQWYFIQIETCLKPLIYGSGCITVNTKRDAINHFITR